LRHSPLELLRATGGPALTGDRRAALEGGVGRVEPEGREGAAGPRDHRSVSWRAGRPAGAGGLPPRVLEGRAAGDDRRVPNVERLAGRRRATPGGGGAGRVHAPGAPQDRRRRHESLRGGSAARSPRPGGEAAVGQADRPAPRPALSANHPLLTDVSCFCFSPLLLLAPAASGAAAPSFRNITRPTSRK